MTTIAVVGGTGYAGGFIAAEAARRGHQVIVASRSADRSATAADNVEYRKVDVLDDQQLAGVVAGADVVISALSPRGELDGKLGDVDRRIADLVGAAGSRLLVVGGYSSLRQEADGPRIIDAGFPPATEAELDGQLAALINEASQMNAILLDLLDRKDDLNWTFFSPGLEFGAHVPGEATGQYRIGTDGTVLANAAGVSAIGGADFAVALIDEAEAGKYPRAHIAVAY
ncbi:NAD(P)H-binding protein [Gordonia sp. N1V]|uniref:NAD(P)-dependent oxidoreductase n=1 Tax=Gordonia sp. N1V TaxID=3034163 RepID=UPI0023E246DE|nr:NAD(P)H-binding protein [Gordonia sp. N1V]MDF3281052.1 NAD(P)H-binding protein [Gordonia sp. N1V]